MCSCYKEDRVVLYPAITSSAGEFFVPADEVLCTLISYLGENRDGIMAEHAVVPTRDLFKIPESFDFGTCVKARYKCFHVV